MTEGGKLTHDSEEKGHLSWGEGVVDGLGCFVGHGIVGLEMTFLVSLVSMLQTTPAVLAEKEQRGRKKVGV